MKRALVLAAAFSTAIASLGGAAACTNNIDLRTRTHPLDPHELPPIIDPTPVTAQRFEVLDEDPFGDGVATTSLFIHDGTLWVGPSLDGTSAVRYSPTGDQKTLVAFSITGDAGSANHSATTFSSFGAPACSPNTTACGPDNEEGPILLQSAVLDGAPTLIAAGGKGRGGFHDVYLGALDGLTARFNVVDLGTAAGVDAKGVSFALPHDGRVALGLPQHGNASAHIVDVERPHNGAAAAHGVDVQGAAAARNVDSMIVVGNLALAASGAGIARSVDGVAGAPLVDVTPAGMDSATSLDMDGNTAQPARDRAVPAFATVDGAVLFGRNTVDGPELWSCFTASCDPADWSSRALSGDRVSALTRVGDALIVAVDDDDGARLSVSYDGNALAPLDGLDGFGARVVAATSATLDGHAWWFALVADKEGGALRLVRVLVPQLQQG